MYKTDLYAITYQLPRLKASMEQVEVDRCAYSQKFSALETARIELDAIIDRDLGDADTLRRLKAFEKVQLVQHLQAGRLVQVAPLRVGVAASIQMSHTASSSTGVTTTPSDDGSEPSRADGADAANRGKGDVYAKAGRIAGVADLSSRVGVCVTRLDSLTAALRSMAEDVKVHALSVAIKASKDKPLLSTVRLLSLEVGGKRKGWEQLTYAERCAAIIEHFNSEAAQEKVYNSLLQARRLPSESPGELALRVRNMVLQAGGSESSREFSEKLHYLRLISSKERTAARVALGRGWQDAGLASIQEHIERTWNGKAHAASKGGPTSQDGSDLESLRDDASQASDAPRQTPSASQIARKERALADKERRLAKKEKALEVRAAAVAAKSAPAAAPARRGPPAPEHDNSGMVQFNPRSHWVCFDCQTTLPRGIAVDMHRNTPNCPAFDPARRPRAAPYGGPRGEPRGAPPAHQANQYTWYGPRPPFPPPAAMPQAPVVAAAAAAAAPTPAEADEYHKMMAFVAWQRAQGP
eukprot:TRINITY_DN4755_c0_g1_i1.p1 TRINITY_DN4755_c0_g1~~TRINITY_DN4755_c0_g1_i1.p1  ORF type:complete len:525 (-),score=57.72 TRINITY_DN4755_c0_g1_i1:406-1980(-)